MKRLSRISQILATLVLSVSAMLPADAQTIDIVATQTILGPDVFLRDIVNDSSILPDGWGKRHVTKLSAPGKSTQHSLSSIARALQKYPDMQNVVLRGQTTLVLSRKGIPLTPDKVTNTIEQFVRSNKQWQNTPTTITVKRITPRITIPDNSAKINVKECLPQKEALNYIFKLTVTTDDGEQSIVSAHVKIAPMQKVWTAKKMIIRGHLLTKDDVEHRLLSLDEAARLIPISENITGMEVNRPIRPGQPLNRRFLLEPRCAKRGETINVVLSSGPLSVMMRATALKEGRRGDHIFCMNKTSKRRLMVKLTGTREASLDAN